MWFLAQDIRLRTVRGVSCLMSSPMRRMICFTRLAWSSSSNMANERVSPSPLTRSASISRRRMRTHSEWKVEMSGLASVACPSRVSTRSAISAAALLVKVTARIASGGTPFSWISQAMRLVITRVFPDPAPARISSGPSVASTAARCSGFNLAMSDCDTRCVRREGSFSSLPFWRIPRRKRPRAEPRTLERGATVVDRGR